MRTKIDEKVRAIRLRKKGLSYSEIRKQIPVAKSSLSLWLGQVSLTKKQKERLRLKSLKHQPMATAALKRKRINKTKDIIKKACSEIRNINNNELTIIGTILYWTEGAKQKEHSPSVGVIFSNSDPKMIKLFLKWLIDCLKIDGEDITFEIYIHRSYKKTQKGLASYWSTVTGFTQSKFDKIYFKKNKVHSYRKNRGENYWGVLRVKVRKSTDLNRKITGWIEGICLRCGVV